jgi:RNA polymerase sigma-70 factor (ECF subfamily)
MSAPIDETGLIQRSREGDLGAFNELVVAYQDQVYGLCLRMLGSRQPAEDVTQEAFISAFRNVSRMRGPSVKSWLLRIASNACIDELRRRQRQRQVSIDRPRDSEGDEPALDPPDRGPGPETLAVREELRAALELELLELPPDQRLAVILCDLEGLAYDEVAATMGTSVGTVKSRISRGRARLREAIQAKPELFGDLVRHTTGSGP